MPSQGGARNGRDEGVDACEEPGVELEEARGVAAMEILAEQAPKMLVIESDGVVGQFAPYRPTNPPHGSASGAEAHRVHS